MCLACCLLIIYILIWTLEISKPKKVDQQYYMCISGKLMIEVSICNGFRQRRRTWWGSSFDFQVQ
ncbi:hypothetical protein HanHA300_Chr09g0323391 [Helianthus annuus]|nr:hypothetical protein HanHA300_Chr09g0323391 [Helianthus annuus]KAJ0542845.1 hypothetical protein HanHA89_Chr09g0344301 [Helianthus annuus]KAJ0707901.1 hypothetical protein HanLR1_Chr09g0323641 [Helianthus annuus]